MLSYQIRDVEGKSVVLRHPLKVSLSFSEDAPADQLRAMFVVEGSVPALSSVEVRQGDERVFYGLIDSQWEDTDQDGILLTITARSLESVLLDNEAMPQTYCTPSMPVLMKRHFQPLGFSAFRGSSQAFSGELVVSKGMSEWTVLKNFCRQFLGTVPFIDSDGVIDISGEPKQDVLRIDPDRLLSFRRIRKNQNLVSEVIARTYSGGGYEMPLRSKKAIGLGIKRRRYVDAIGSSSRTVLSVKEQLRQYNRGYEQIIVECGGFCFCEIGSGLALRDPETVYHIREIDYTLDVRGERTKIYAEVRENENI